MQIEREIGELEATIGGIPDHERDENDEGAFRTLENDGLKPLGGARIFAEKDNREAPDGMAVSRSKQRRHPGAEMESRTGHA